MNNRMEKYQNRNKNEGSPHCAAPNDEASDCWMSLWQSIKTSGACLLTRTLKRRMIHHEDEHQRVL